MSDLDDLMSIDPLELSPADLERQIDYIRANYYIYQGGGKPKKDAPKLKLEDLGLKKPQPIGKIRRI
jgi:hypothetical protein